MPYRRKDSPIWWVSLTDASGKRSRRSTGTTDLREAKALEGKWRLEAHRGRRWDEQPGRTFDQLMIAYLEGPSRQKRSGERDRYGARHLYRRFTGRPLASLTAADVRGYIDARHGQGAAAATVNKELGLLSAAINYAMREWGWNICNPVARRRLREPEGRVRWLRPEQAQALLVAARREPRSPYLADFIRLALHTGMRKGELLGLEWARVDLSAGLLHLDAAHTKGGRRRSVPLNAEARAAVIGRLQFRAAHCPASPWVFCTRDGERVGTIHRGFQTACLRAGIEDFHVHDLRHTCAAWLVSAGVALPEVRDLLGHRSVQMTERYAHLAPENVRSAVRRLEGWSRSGHEGDREGSSGSG